MGILCSVICLKFPSRGRSLLCKISRQLCGALSFKTQALQFSLRTQESSDCRQPTGKLPKSELLLHLERLTNELTIHSFRFGALFVDIYMILASCLIKKLTGHILACSFIKITCLCLTDISGNLSSFFRGKK